MSSYENTSPRNADDSGLIDAVPCGVVVFADNGSVLTVNRTLSQLVGFDEAELVGSHIEKLFTVPTRIFFQTHFFPLIRMHGRADEIYLTLQPKAGPRIPVFANAVRRDDGAQPSTICAIMPVYERERYEDELRRARAAAESANRAKSIFLATVSHEVRTPINAIIGYIELLEMEIAGPLTEQQRESLRRVRDGSRILLDQINDVLDLAKIESGEMQVEIAPRSLKPVIDRALELVEPLADRRGLTVVRQCSADELTFMGDEERTVQVMLNLLSNAVKFTEEGGTVTIACSAIEHAGKRWLQLSVTDTGVGIAEDQLESIFEPFVQADSSHTSGGTGLGLTISRRIAKLMSGDLTVSSKLGEGSTFTLWLPSS